jgi:hypothetical protein
LLDAVETEPAILLPKTRLTTYYHQLIPNRRQSYVRTENQSPSAVIAKAGSIGRKFRDKSIPGKLSSECRTLTRTATWLGATILAELRKNEDLRPDSPVFENQLPEKFFFRVICKQQSAVPQNGTDRGKVCFFQ